MWRDHPVLGVGPDNFRLIYGRYLSLRDFDNRIHSNSLIIETLANLGTLGIFSLTAIFVPLTLLLWRTWREAASVEVRLVMIGFAASILSFFLHGLVDYFLEFTPIYGLFWLLAGMAAGLGRSKAIP